MIEGGSFLRVVVSRRGKVRPAEFRLREGEIGLSLFQSTSEVAPGEIVAAVRAAGKRGELAVVEIPTRVFHDLGLRIIPTLGGTPVDEINRLHVEARYPWGKRIWLRIRGIAVYDYFNENASPRLADAAVLVEEGEL